jgi:hypothetical protein
MRARLRLVILLILAIALRGMSVTAFAMPAAAAMVPASQTEIAGCHEDGTVAAPVGIAAHEGHDKSCQISCDLGVAPALTTVGATAAVRLPAVFTPARPALSLLDAPPPDHPPPIR